MSTICYFNPEAVLEMLKDKIRRCIDDSRDYGGNVNTERAVDLIMTELSSLISVEKS